MLKKILLISLLVASPILHANNDKHFSGVYACKGHNSKVGDYGFTLTLKLNKADSRGEAQAYDVSGQTENATHYYGKALAVGNKMSLAFRISDYKENTFGVGMASFKTNQDKERMFTTQYYEPGEDSDISGREVCTYQSAVPATSAAAPKKSDKTADEPSGN